MAVGYSLAYYWGITPWQHGSTTPDPPFERLLDREESFRERPFGRALDLGCGTGAHSRAMQARGWDVIGVDVVRTAVDIAVHRSDETGRYVIGDVTHLPGSGVGSGFSLFVDVGCFHGLTKAHREAMGRGVTELATPDASLLAMCFPRGHRGLAPRGADADDLLDAFPGWELLDERAADTSAMTRSTARHEPRWFRLARRS